jgi:putative effector of murein hydrolase LrgA (UPF0299 family)
MDYERIGIEVILSATAWFLAVLLAFFFVGPAVGIVVILAGLALFGWWLARAIRA